jgi:hypothetical protein
VIDRMSRASELRQTCQVLGPLIDDVETIPEEDMNSLDFFNHLAILDEDGIES